MPQTKEMESKKVKECGRGGKVLRQIHQVECDAETNILIMFH